MWDDALVKFGNAAGAVVVFVAVLLLVFFVAGRASGRISKPLAVGVFLGPALVLLLVGLVIPAIRTLYLSFYNDSSDHFLGGANYTWAFTTSDIQQVLLNTLLWIIVAPVAATSVGLLLALLVDRLKRQALYK
jgi:alpha-glucoside transport system permease protein